MIKYLNKQEVIQFLTCPNCFNKSGHSTLKINQHGFMCNICKRKYKVKSNVLEFILPNQLDRNTKRELKGNSFPLNQSTINHYANKDNWSDYYNYFTKVKFDYLMKYLNNIKMKGIFSLGSGQGFELKEILKRKKMKLIFSSDLAFSATAMVPSTLKRYSGKLCLFTSNLNYSPVIANDNYPILIYEALHHTNNIHLTIGKLLLKKYKYIIFVEPTTNILIKILAKFGLAQRIEYSGLKPDFLDIKKLSKLTQKYRYHMDINTIWDVPEEFVRVFCKPHSRLENVILAIINLISKTGNIIKFGSFSIVLLERIDKKII